MRDSITVNAVLNEIRLHANHPQNKNVVFILVEGESDIRLFRSLFNQENCKVKAIPGGNSKLEQGLSILCQEFEQVIGIRDADFMRLEGKKPQIAVLFLTDSHDIETMMITSDEAFKSVVNEFYNNAFSVLELRKAFLDSVRFLGYLRWYNNLNNMEFNFREIGIGDFFDSKTLKLDEIKCIQNVINRSPNCKCNDVDTILNDVNTLMKPKHDLIQVCCGHDIVNSMAIFFNYHKSGMKGINGDRIQSQFRTAYNNHQFSNTELFKELSSWALVKNFQLI
jgi:hypothetical protein